ncbi:NEW3 domain-containing protein [Humibacillus xanthopallidus]|uniref:NEW3 domain-containing protein n=1 Tax=Humibacillus xanthopallidus TaxID=412689 RepID=UPI0038508FB3
MRRRWFAATVSALVTALILPVAAAGADDKGSAPAAPDPCTEHIAYQVDAAGFFNAGVGTDGMCTPQPGAWDLTYRWPNGPGTGYTTVKTESGVYVLGQDLSPVRAVDAAPGSSDTTSLRDYVLPSGLRLTQQLEIIDGFTAGRKDTVKVSYTFDNPTGEAQQAELRVMLDTELNYNDGAPFQLPGVGAVTTEREFTGADVPDYFAAFADFQDPVHIAAGILKTPGEITPNRVVFGTWPNLSTNRWDVTTNPLAPITYDSAVAMYFRPPSTGATIPPGESVTYTTRYGRASASSDFRPPLSMTVLAPGEAALGSPFKVSVFVTNVGTGPATNGAARLYVPSGFTVSEPTVVSLVDPLSPNQTQQVTWTVTPVDVSLVGLQPISVTTAADNAAEKIVTRTIQVLPGSKPLVTYPLLGAHGITGQAADMNVVLDTAANTVPALSGRESVPTGAITSVWTNGATIVDYTRGTLLPRVGASKTNVIAHSKGGLDTRVAMWTDPELFDTLGMLATPNAGSGSADKLCFLRRLPWGDRVQSGMGACDSDADGLYNLQTDYMRDVFNVIVRDHAQHLKVVAAGDCTGTGRITCNAGSAAAGCESDRNGRIHGDSVVCVESAFARTTGYSDGLAHALSPIFDADHTQMRTTVCPTTRVLAELYPLDSEGNTWLTTGSCNGQSLLRSASTTSTSSATSLTSSGGGTDFFAGQPTADQVPTVAAGSPTSPARFVVDPEAGDRAQATVVLPAGTTATVTVTRPDGSSDPSAVVTSTDIFGDTAYVVSLTGLAGTSRTVSVAPERSAQVGLLSTVLSGGVTATAAVTPGTAATPSAVTVSLSGLSAAATRSSTVTIAWPEAGSRRDLPLTYDGTSNTFRGSFVAPPGTFVPVDVSVSAAGRSRMLTAGLVVPDDSGTFSGLGGSALVDTSGDGRPDVFRVPVRVSVAASGTYQVAVDLRAGGRVVLSAPGAAQLPAGAGVIDVDVPVRELLLVGVDGPFEVTSAVLTEGVSTRRIVARAASLGQTGDLRLGQVATATVALSLPTPASVDSDRDGRYDLLRFSGTASVPAGGDYLLSGKLVAPNGLVVGTQERTVALTAGRAAYAVEFPGELVGANGSGRYTLTGLTLTSVTDPKDTDRMHRVETAQLNAAEWIGGSANATTLREMWAAAEASGAIAPFGLYVAESNRLERVERAIATGDLSRARAELDTFIQHVNAAGGVDADWRQRLVGYATSLRAAV